MAKCSNCGKAVTFGHAVSHSKRATNRPFHPNLQRLTIWQNGKAVKTTMCAKCIKSLGKVR
jgi:large subunit ribosomal protein L28